jgi:hypothetical protein
VEECIKAETGVGAAIAAGSQEEKGICARLVIAAKTTNTADLGFLDQSHYFSIKITPRLSSRG